MAKSSAVKLFLAAIAGLLLPLGFAPFEWRICVMLSISLLFLLLVNCSASLAFRLGFVYGLAGFGLGISWVYNSLYEFGGAHEFVAALITLALVLLMAFYIAVFAWSAVRFLSLSLPVFLLLCLPLSWCLMEWLRSWLLTGFPWLLLGYSQIDTLFAGILPVVGVLGSSLLLCLLSGSIVLLIKADNARHRYLAITVILVLLLFSVFVRHVEWTEDYGQAVAVAAVQGNIPQKIKMDPDYLQVSLQTYLDLSQIVDGIDLFVWPETAVPTYDFQVASYLAEVDHILPAVITGIFTYDAETQRLYNSLIKLDGQDDFNEDSQRYRKQRLVPFGEYLPLRSLLSLFGSLVNLPVGDLSAAEVGQSPMLLQTTKIQLGASICYESAYSSIFRRQLPSANLFINVSNDAWFGQSFAPYQHLEILRARALETGRPMVRATNTGISAFIDAKGKLVKTLALNKVGVLQHKIMPKTGLTPYVAGGYAIVLGFIILGIMTLLLYCSYLQKNHD